MGIKFEDIFPRDTTLQALILDGEQASDIWPFTFYLTTPQKENMVSIRRHTRSNLNPKQVLVYSDPKNLVTWRNVRECQISSPLGNNYLETSPSSIHRSYEYVELVDIPLDIHFSSKFPS